MLFKNIILTVLASAAAVAALPEPIPEALAGGGHYPKPVTTCSAVYYTKTKVGESKTKVLETKTKYIPVTTVIWEPTVKSKPYTVVITKYNTYTTKIPVTKVTSKATTKVITDYKKVPFTKTWVETKSKCTTKAKDGGYGYGHY